MKWTYDTYTVSGNFASAAHYVTTFHPEWDVVAAMMSGAYTIIMYRVAQ